MPIKNFQRSKLTFQRRSLNILKHSFLQKPIRPFELEFHMKTPYDKLAKIYIN